MRRNDLRHDENNMVIRINYLRQNTMFDIPLEEGAPSFKQGDFVILEVKEEDYTRTEVGRVVFIHDLETIEHNPPKLVRKATEDDLTKINRIAEEEKKAFADFIVKIQKYDLPMQPASVFFSFDEKFADFVYTAEDRVDFRELVKDLVSSYKKKIFLQQVSARERSGLSGGCGTCGRTLCCSTFLRDRPPVTMGAVREQDLYFKDKDKLTGLCGKLKCCLNYEVSVYQELGKKFPGIKSKIKVISTGRKGIVIGRSVLDQMVRIAYDEEGIRPENMPLGAISIVSDTKKYDKREEFAEEKAE